MRKWTINSLMLFALAAPAQSQGPKQARGAPADKPAVKKEAPKELTLEEMLDRALKANPDMRVAEAKVQEAEAELNRTRLLVMQKVIRVNAEILGAKYLLQEVEDRLKAAKRAHQTTVGGVKVIAEEEFREKERSLQKAKADLARLQAEMSYLLGKSPHESKVEASHALLHALMAQARLQLQGEKQYSVPENLGEKIRRAMAVPVKVHFDNATPRDILQSFWKQANVKGINIIVNEDALLYPPGGPGSSEGGVLKKSVLQFREPIPLGAALQWFEDAFGWRILIRDYGLMFISQNHAPPRGAIYLQDFLKSPKPSAK